MTTIVANSEADRARAEGLVRIGREAIARENADAFLAYFADDFAFHGVGAELNREQLMQFQGALRAAFDDFSVERDAVIVQGDFAASRTIFTGTFARPLELPPHGRIPPTRRPFRLELQNMFRYDSAGRLAEEWIQYDTVSFLRELGVR